MIGNTGKNTNSFPVTSFGFVEKFIIAGEELLSGKIPRKEWLRQMSHCYTPFEVYKYATLVARQPALAYAVFGVPVQYSPQGGELRGGDKKEAKKKAKPWRRPEYSSEELAARQRRQSMPARARAELLALSAAAKDRIKEAKERRVDAARDRVFNARVEALHGVGFHEQMNTFGRMLHSTLESAGEAMGKGLMTAVREDAPNMASTCAAAAVEGAESVVTDRIEGFVARMRALIKSVQDAAAVAFADYKEYLAIIGKVLAVALPVWFFYALGKWTGISQIIVSAVSRYFVPEIPECSPQMGENGETELVGQMLLAATLAALIPKDKKQAKMWGPFVALMTKSSSFVSGAKGLVDWVCEGLQWTMNTILRLIGSGEVKWFRKRSEQIEEWLERGREYLKSEDTIPPEEIVRHWSDGQDLAKTAVGQVVKGEIDSMLRLLTQKWNVARTERALMKAARPEPVCMVLHGAPGIGKSISLEYFHKFITVATNPDIADKVRTQAAEGVEYPLSAHAYVKDAGKYWTGYNPAQHTTMILDDGGTRLPSPGADDSDFINLMRIINSAPVSLDMPDVESKGNVFFRSPFVIVSTNLDKGQWHAYASKAISNPDALERRLKLFLTVKIVNPKFIKGGAVTYDALEPTKARHSGGKLDVDAWSQASPEEQDTAWSFEGTWDTQPVSFTSRKAVAQFVSAKMMEARGHFIKMSANSTNHALMDALGITIGSASPQGGLETDSDTDTHDRVMLKAEEAWRHTCASLRASGFGSKTLVWAIAGFLEWVDNTPLPVVMINAFLWGMVLRMFFDLVVSGIRAMYNYVFPGKKPACKPQSQDPEHVMNNVTNNYYALGVVEPGETEMQRVGSVLFVKGEYALMPHHFLRSFAKARSQGRYADKLPALKSFGTGKMITLEWSNLDPAGSNVHQILGTDGEHQDLCIVKIGGRAHKDLTGSFMHAGTRRPLDLGWVTVSPNCTPRWEDDFRGVEYLRNFVYKDNMVQHAVAYRKATSVGDCGSVVVSQGECGRVYIMGIHVAGADDESFGVAGLVFQDQIDRAISKLKVSVERLTVTSRSTTQEKFVPCSPQGSKLEQRAVALTSLKNGMPDRPDAAPSMVPSLTVGWSSRLFQHDKVPSTCTEAATELALETYAEPRLFPLDGALGPYAYEAARAMLDDVGAPERFNLRIPSNVEAVNGRVYGVNFAEPINRRTSSGYPWQNMGHTKLRMFDPLTGEVMMGAETTKVIFREADELLDSLLAGDDKALEYVLFKVTPKREMRKRGKAPRVIQGAPLHLVIVFRRLFWAFMGHFAEWTPEKELAIGLDPVAHWTDLHDWLVDKRPPGFGSGFVGAGDYKQFDQCQEPCIMTAAGEAVLDRYYTGGPADSARRLLWRTLCGARVVFRNVVYQLDKGMPSGHPATSVANGLYNGVLFRMAYASISMGGNDAWAFPGTWEAYLRSVQEFREHVHLSVCGDDNIFSTDRTDFNEMALAECMARFGARYTLDKKDEVAAQPFRPLTEVSYLGRAFRWEKTTGRWVAPLRLESVAIMGQYAEKESQLTPEWYSSVAKQIREELSFHEQDVWDAWMPFYKATFMDRGYVAPFRTPDGDSATRIVWQPKTLVWAEEQDIF